MATQGLEAKDGALPAALSDAEDGQDAFQSENMSVQIKLHPKTKHMDTSVSTNPEIILPSGEPLTLSSSDLIRVKTVADFMRLSNKNEAKVTLHKEWASVDGKLLSLDSQGLSRFCLPGSISETSGSETSEDSESTETSENSESSEDSEDSENTESSESSETKESGMMTPDTPLPGLPELPSLLGKGCASAGLKPKLPSTPLVIELSAL